MIKYFIDTEFSEGFHKPMFGKKRHFIDLISIGIYCEDGRSYYAISNEFNPKDADLWVKENVISKLPSKHFNGSNAHEARLWKSNKQIADEIIQFISYSFEIPEFYAYYADYDWVLFCSLFGRMPDLPNGFPMYCIDLKQTLDEKQITYSQKFNNKTYLTPHQGDIKLSDGYPSQNDEHNSLSDAKWNYKLYKFLQTI